MTRRLTAITTVALAAILMVMSIIGSPQAQGTDDPRGHDRRGVPSPGDVLHNSEIRFIDHPGRYGLGKDLPGSRYAIVAGHLVRIDPNTLQVQSILRRDSHVGD